MTPFEYCVLSLVALFAFTNVAQLSESPKIHELPKWHLYIVMLLIFLSTITLINTVVNLILGV